MTVQRSTYSLKKNQLKSSIEITLPASKSISNRVLIIDALCQYESKLHNLSEARDTQTMIRLLNSTDDSLDVMDAGTTIRFLTSYLSATNQQKTLTGTMRMQQRPIGILVDALRTLGAKISYKHNEGFPPIEIVSFSQKENAIKIRGNVSSQYISSLLMVAPTLPEGLRLTIEGKIGSRPYINMTLRIMERFGVRHVWERNAIIIHPQQYKSSDFTVEPDWSAASYWYSFVALSEQSKVLLKGLSKDSLQGDSVIVDIMRHLGVDTQFTNKGALLTKSAASDSFFYDFSDCPDLAQTIVVMCAVLGVNAQMKGLESLKIKETDRIAALQNELKKISGDLVENSNTWEVIPSAYLPNQVTITTYEDHRMAMAFAPLCLRTNVSFNDSSVVAKSYPNFWNDIEKSVN